MANVREQVRLSRFTTLGWADRPAVSWWPAPTRRSSPRCGTPTGAMSLCWSWAAAATCVISDNGFPGTVIQVATKGIHRMTGPDAAGPDRQGPDEAGPRQAEPGAPVTLTVAAGEEWDTVVASCVAADLAGLECLSGIPGLTGATPIQNVGAYGQEVADTITRVRAYDRASGHGGGPGRGRLRVRVPDQRLQAEHHASRGDRPVRRPRGDLPADQRPAVPAGPLRRAGRRPGPGGPPAGLRQAGQGRGRARRVQPGGRAPLGDVRSAVLRLRRGKGMVLDPGDPDSRSAGSFFTNPVLDAAQFASAAPGGGRAVRPRCPDPAVPGRAGPGEGAGRLAHRPGRVRRRATRAAPPRTGTGRARRRASPPSTPWPWSTRAAPARPTWSAWPGRSATGSVTSSGSSWPASRCWSASACERDPDRRASLGRQARASGRCRVLWVTRTPG